MKAPVLQTLAKPANKRSAYKVPNLERGLRIMELLLDYPEGLAQSEIASLLHYSKTSVFRITLTLLEYGYLIRNEETHNLSLSRKLLAMGSKALCEEDLMSNTIGVLRSLRDKVRETVLIGTLSTDQFIVLEQVLGTHPFKFSVAIGAQLPLHTAAPAKAMLAFLPEQELQAIIRRMNFVRFNDNTITCKDRFKQELATVRSRGYAFDQGEQLAGIHCVAVPIFDRHRYPIAAVWTTGPADRIPTTALPALGELFLSQVKLISARQGYGLLQETTPLSKQ